tara:strand:- start:28252 stop:29307 length:1056 start_codon:yes stop_codon:yes gene_type:complete
MKIKAISLLVCLFAPLFVLSQVPQYYSTVNFSATQQVLKQQLSNLITTTHTYELTYTPEVWDVVKESDLEYTYGDDVLLLYGYNDNDGISKTDRTRDKDANCTSSSCIGLWNREHVYPRSLATPDLETSYPGAGTDAHAIRASDSQMNSSRGNRIFEDGNGNSYITSNGNFYPGDEWKGDVARIVMYMYLRYPSRCEAVMVGHGDISYSYFNDIPDIFLEWNAEDPVSEFEQQRNEVIYGSQGNRNPFIDNPYLATMIWNGPEAEDLWEALDISENITVSTFLYPTVTSGVVFLESETQTSFNFEVYTVSGQFIMNGTAEEKIDLEGLSKGMYFIQLQNQNHTQTEKIILR